MSKKARIENPIDQQHGYLRMDQCDRYLVLGFIDIIEKDNKGFPKIVRLTKKACNLFDPVIQPTRKSSSPLQSGIIKKPRQIGNSIRSTRRIALRKPYTPEELHWRESVLLRDNYACVFCGSTERLEADHIKPRLLYPHLAYAIDNGRALCHWCHVQTPTYGGKVKRLVRVDVE